MKSAPGFDGTPAEYELALGAIRGYRHWRVNRHGHLEPLSVSVSCWEPGENVAVCDWDTAVTLMLRQVPGIRHVAEHVTKLLREAPAAAAARGREAKPIHYEPEPEDGDHDNHGCGFWAYHDVPSAEFNPGPPPEMTGKVRLFVNVLRVFAWARKEPVALGVINGDGRVLIGEKGYRARRARIAAVTIPPVWHRIATSIPTVAVQAGLIALVAAAYRADGWWSFPAFVVSLWAAWFYRKAVYGRVRWIRYAGRVRGNYPDVPFFTSKAAMVRAYPPVPPPQ